MSYGLIVGSLLIGNIIICLRWEFTKNYGIKLVMRCGEGYDGLYIHLGARTFVVIKMPKGWRKGCRKPPLIRRRKYGNKKDIKIMFADWKKNGAPIGRDPKTGELKKICINEKQPPVFPEKVYSRRRKNINDKAVIIAMRNFTNRELARIILYKQDMAEVFYRNMSTICADMIRENIRVVDVIDDGFSNYTGMSGKGLYEHFIEIIEEMEKTAAAGYSTRSKKEGAK
jgi:hypothetical protein